MWWISKKKYEKMFKLFNELKSHIWENGGFVNEKGTFHSDEHCKCGHNHMNTNKQIAAHWSKFNRIGNEFRRLK